MLARLCVGKYRSGSIACLPMCLGGLIRPTGECLVTGDERPAANVRSAGRRACQCVCHTGVEQPPTSQAEPVVGDVPEPAMREVVANIPVVAQGARADEAPSDQLVKAVDSLGFGPAAGRLHSVE